MSPTEELRTRIMSREDIQTVAKVLKELESNGLEECVVGSSFIRDHIANKNNPGDIDVIYKGKVKYEEAQKILSNTLEKLNIDPLKWDVQGIWNINQRFPDFTNIREQYGLAFCSTIESVVIMSDGKLHDLSGRGLEDALTNTLQLIHLTNPGLNYPIKRQVYFCMDGCRKIFEYDWKPTPESEKFIRESTHLWNELSKEDQDYLIEKRIENKFTEKEKVEAKKVYARYGWGFVFKNI